MNELEDKIPIPLDEPEERKEVVLEEKPIKFVEKEAEPEIDIRVSQTHDPESEGEAVEKAEEVEDEEDEMTRLRKENALLKERVSDLEFRLPIPLDRPEERQEVVLEEKPIKFVT